MGSKSGEFCSKFAYALAEDNYSPFPASDCWGKIWKINSLPKIRNSLWLCCQKKLACNAILHKSHIIESNLCPICFDHPEKVEHILRDCDYAKEFWSLLNPSSNLNSNLPLVEWIIYNVGDYNRNLDIFTPNAVIFPFARWALWHNRDKFVFEQNLLLPKDNCEAVKARATEFYHLFGKFKSPSRIECIMVKWDPPNAPFYELNTDGSAIGSLGKASAGRLLRNHLGQWIKGFSRNLGTVSSIEAKIWALHDGLDMEIK